MSGSWEKCGSKFKQHPLNPEEEGVLNHGLKLLKRRGLNASKDGSSMKKYKCLICDYIYDPAKGDPDHGINPGTAFENLPASWTCPGCGAAKSDFAPVE
jgi:rubredoxin